MDKVQLGKLTLYNGDNMELLKSLPDNAFELAIVDPPYGDAEGFGRAGDERGRIVCSKNSRFEKYKQTDKMGGGIGTDSEGGLIGTRKIVNHAWGGDSRGINTKRRNMVCQVCRTKPRRRLSLTSLSRHT